MVAGAVVKRDMRHQGRRFQKELHLHCSLVEWWPSSWSFGS